MRHHIMLVKNMINSIIFLFFAVLAVNYSFLPINCYAQDDSLHLTNITPQVTEKIPGGQKVTVMCKHIVD